MEDLVGMAWASASAQYYSARLFGPVFAHRCEVASWTCSDTTLLQLHPWVLWHRELGLPPPLSAELRSRCLSAFRASTGTFSILQGRIVAALAELCTHVEQELVTKEGYKIDFMVMWHGKNFAMEFVKPGHFLMGRHHRSANAATLLRHEYLVRKLRWQVRAQTNMPPAKRFRQK
eukprot:gnl/TRDRNA2_/TRDRNA2_203732_c0_seq1.p1 gnl/TRDRNA2_/TRDRNA2_203732_c0~~gnl/TRDRNA2_/TRDRNA2_203732_c0_seq1.p1  ORF type:complete len:175 (+),score=18.24 gnl/TRDRNA2_/TRDRNA2_203732_c0_seq1:569-1093(+)